MNKFKVGDTIIIIRTDLFTGAKGINYAYYMQKGEITKIGSVGYVVKSDNDRITERMFSEGELALCNNKCKECKRRLHCITK